MRDVLLGALRANLVHLTVATALALTVAVIVLGGGRTPTWPDPGRPAVKLLPVIIPAPHIHVVPSPRAPAR